MAIQNAPAPGEAPLPAADAAALLRSNAAGPHADRVAVRFGDRTWTHAGYHAESSRWAQLFVDRHRSSERPLHVGVLLDNTPDYLFALGGAALAGATVVGLNHTRTGEHLARDVRHTDVDLLVTEPGHWPDVEGIRADVPGVELIVSHRFPRHDDPPDGADDLDEVLDGLPREDPGLEPGPDTRWALIFTSGTSSAPKAVVCSQRRLLVTGNRMVMLMDLTAEDVGYVCMPLFHSNALMVGWAPSIVVGAGVALARRFSASGWLPDVRRHGATWFNYTGKPLSYILATPARADDADNPVRVAFGNEGSPEVLETFAARFGVRVIDAFGSTEGAIAVSRDAPPRRGAMGVAGPTVLVVDADGRELPPARFDADGRLLNAEECVGEIVNTAGAGPFEGYYNNDEATASALRGGWYWSGDLGYLDEERYLYFAGRTADWIRVDGENFPAGPIDEAVAAHPGVVVAAAYGVPDVHAGDQLAVAVVPRGGVRLDPVELARWIDESSGLPPKWRPRYLRIADELPTTGTNKVVKRTLVHQKVRRDRLGDDVLWVRDRGEPAFRPFTAADEEALREALVAAGRANLWEI